MTAPITSALRRLMTAEGARVTADRDEFCGICDAVDSIHARKLKALDASTARVDELCRENERLRGLVWDMWLDLQKQLTPPWSGEYRQRMHELEMEP